MAIQLPRFEGCLSKVISILIKEYITNTINVTVLKKEMCFVIAFGARDAHPAVCVGLNAPV